MKFRFLTAFLALACLWQAIATAQPISPDETQRIWAEAQAATTVGPAQIPLEVYGIAQGTLALPAGHTFIPQPHANKVLNAMGNPGTDDRMQGLVFPEADAPWFMIIRFESSGYVKDDDAQQWDVDELLQSYKDGTESANAERVRMGVPEMEILGWAQMPQYDSNTHRLAWAMSSRDKGAASNEPQGVNYNTYALGREGYFSLNLVTDLSELPKYKANAHALLDAMQFAEGKRYSDFNPNTDHVAEYGLAALVVGAVAKKAGLFATLALFLAKFWKIIAIAVVAFGSGLTNWLKNRKPQVPERRSPDATVAGEAATESLPAQPPAAPSSSDQDTSGDPGPRT